VTHFKGVEKQPRKGKDLVRIKGVTYDLREKGSHELGVILKKRHSPPCREKEKKFGTQGFYA